MTERVAREIILIDLSSLAYPLFHTAKDPSEVSTQVVARVRSLTAERPFAAICCDSGKSFRSEIATSYKANRPERDATLQHQITLAREQLVLDGYQVWAVPGFEADDLIATAVHRALALEDVTVLVVTGDKDLLQLVGPRVRALGATNGVVMDESGVGTKFGVLPRQLRDYLTLVGDASDNVAGAQGIGPKNAGALLSQFDSLDALYEQLQTRGAAACGIKPAIATALKAFKATGAMETSRKLVTLRTDVDLPFDVIFETRKPKDAETAFDVEDDSETDEPLPPARTFEAPSAAATTEQVPAPTQAMAIREPGSIVVPAGIEWERGLDPRSMGDARKLALDMHQSRMFSAYGTPQGVLSTIMVGRELGIPAMASLRSIHVIESRHALSAQLMVALVLKSGMAEYFEPEDITDKHAIFVTKRRGARKEIRLEHTVDMAKTAGLLKKDSNWEKVPTDMCVARCQARLCRLVYPDVVLNLYTPEELREMSAVAA